MIRPPKVSGNGKYDATLLGLAKKQIPVLQNLMSFQGLEQGAMDKVELDNGRGYVDVTIIFGQPYLHITYTGTEEEEEEEELQEVADGRFFVRVGNPETDVELDEFGHVANDYTRYYWINFDAKDAGSFADRIAFYSSGVQPASPDLQTVREVSRQTFLDVVNFPDYMFHNYIRSFDLTGEDKVSARFVAGCHFLAVDDAFMYQPSIAVPPGGDIDGLGVSMNPPNRFYVDLESRTMCWYHVLQEWKVTTPIIHTISTGSVSCAVVGVDLVEDAWTVVKDQSISFSGATGDSYGVTTTDSESVYEPVGVATDITSLDRSQISFDIPYQSTPISLTYNIADTPEIESCYGKSSMYTLLATEEGYAGYKSVDYEKSSGDRSDVLKEDTEFYREFSTFDCGSTVECPEYNPELLYEGGYYTEQYSPWAHLNIGLSVKGTSDVGHSNILRGSGNADLEEYVYCRVRFCRQEVGICENNSGTDDAVKHLVGYIDGSFGRRHEVTIPIHNVALHKNTHTYLNNVTLHRRVEGPPEDPDWEDSFASATEVWSSTRPMYFDDNEVRQQMTTSYPRNFAIEDPVNWLPLQYYPREVDPLEKYQLYTTNRWQHVLSNFTSSDTETVDTCVIEDCPRTFTASELISVSILDDRWSAGSHGIVHAIKSNAIGETAILHDGADKTQAIVDALIRDGLIGEGEALIDIGLI